MTPAEMGFAQDEISRHKARAASQDIAASLVLALEHIEELEKRLGGPSLGRLMIEAVRADVLKQGVSPAELASNAIIEQVTVTTVGGDFHNVNTGAQIENPTRTIITIRLDISPPRLPKAEY